MKLFGLREGSYNFKFYEEIIYKFINLNSKYFI